MAFSRFCLWQKRAAAAGLFKSRRKTLTVFPHTPFPSETAVLDSMFNALIQLRKSPEAMRKASGLFSYADVLFLRFRPRPAALGSWPASFSATPDSAEKPKGDEKLHKRNQSSETGALYGYLEYKSPDRRL
nr:hypothetical protein [uncultured Dysosmobacter sp.]